MSDSAFIAASGGLFHGVRTWTDLDRIWQAVRDDAATGWYGYTLKDGPPRSCLAPEELARFITELDALLRRDHRSEYCGFVYADDLERPAFIKVYAPKTSGGCGCSGVILPGWILSRMAPVDLVAATAATAPKPWWERWRRD